MADHGGFTVRGDTGHVVGELRWVGASIYLERYRIEIWTGTQWVPQYSPEGIEAHNTALRTCLK